MDKIKIGLPRAIFNYYCGDMLSRFFEYLGCDVIVSPKTNKEIYSTGVKYANYEMCSAMKIYFGHVAYLQDKVDYIVIPRIDNFGIDNQMCTNFMALFDIIRNTFNVNILNYNIDYRKNKKEYDGLFIIAKKLNFKEKSIKTAYIKAKKDLKMLNKVKINENYHKLLSKNKKILLVGHPYVVYDNLLGRNIIELLNKNNIEIIYSYLFNKDLLDKESLYISKTNYFKYSKEILGSINIARKYVDGIVFLSSFPCSLDAISNELAILKCDLPCINIIIDDINSITGIDSRIESFCDIIERKKVC